MDGDRLVKRVFAWFIGVPIGIVAVILSIANRRPVTFSLDPLSTGDPVVALEVPLFLLLFGAGFIGLLLGWLVGWGGQAHLRRELRARRRQTQSDAPRTAPSLARALVTRS